MTTPSAAGTPDPYSRNPLLTAARIEHPERFARAARTATRPTLVTAGDLPPFTASGLDPQLLLTVPWQARHAVASAPTTAAAYGIIAEDEGFSHSDAAPWAAVQHGGDPANAAYAQRIREWLSG